MEPFKKTVKLSNGLLIVPTSDNANFEDGLTHDERVKEYEEQHKNDTTDVSLTEFPGKPVTEDNDDYDHDIDHYYLELVFNTSGLHDGETINKTIRFSAPFIDKLENYQVAVTKFHCPMTYVYQDIYGICDDTISDQFYMYFFIQRGTDIYGRQEFLNMSYFISGFDPYSFCYSLHRAIRRCFSQVIADVWSLPEGTPAEQQHKLRLEEVCTTIGLANEDNFTVRFHNNNLQIIFKDDLMNTVGQIGQENYTFRWGFSEIVMQKIFMLPLNDRYECDHHIYYALNSVKIYGACIGGLWIYERGNWKKFYGIQSIRILIPDIALRPEIDPFLGKFDDSYLENKKSDIIFQHDIDYSNDSLEYINDNPTVFKDLRKCTPVKQLHILMECITVNGEKKPCTFSKKMAMDEGYFRLRLLFRKKKASIEGSGISLPSSEPPPIGQPQLLYIPRNKLKLDTF